MKKALVCQEDLMRGVRKSAVTEDMGQIAKVIMERNGEAVAAAANRTPEAESALKELFIDEIKEIYCAGFIFGKASNSYFLPALYLNLKPLLTA
jgi:hypothetical protein